MKIDIDIDIDFNQLANERMNTVAAALGQSMAPDDFMPLQERVDAIFTTAEQRAGAESRRAIGFICINKASDTWIPRTLYEARRREWFRMIRRAERTPVKRIQKKRKATAKGKGVN